MLGTYRSVKDPSVSSIKEWRNFVDNRLPELPLSVLAQYPQPDRKQIQKLLAEALPHLGRKIIVLDDDPTGIQTVHDVSVYTDWSCEALRDGFRETSSMFFVLTNSRSFTTDQTIRVHREIAENIAAVSRKTEKDFVIISRSDSTLRGHFPQETETLRSVLEEKTGKQYCGEILLPFFKEGGRFTIGNVHYVQDRERLIPAAQTEFASDKSFGFQSSNLAEYCEEKTQGAFPAKEVTCIALEDLRACRIDKIAKQLEAVSGFGKVVVNAIDYCDVEVFALAFLRAVSAGKEFIFRSAAALTKVLGGVSDKPVLTKEQLVKPSNTNGGIILIGSHVNKTTLQLDELKKSSFHIEFIEFNQHLVLQEGKFAEEVKRVVSLAEENICEGKTVAVYTRRDRFDLTSGDEDAQLRVSVEISGALTDVIGRLTVRPNFIIAKGGITSSDVGTKALHVKRAVVMGQIQPGVPVWMTGSESKFPDMPYVIFPGNVGETDSLRRIVELLASPVSEGVCGPR
jgi:uncharacterized protein YgbK (DUF1537 family)